MADELVATWFGAFLLDGGRVVREHLAPADEETLAERMRSRHRGELVEEETALRAELGGSPARTRDRRLLGGGVELGADRGRPPEPGSRGFDPALLRSVMIAVAESELAEAWDPSIHVEEAVRSMTDLDSVRNLVGERLASWASRDLPSSDDGPEDADGAARSVLEGAVSAAGRAPQEPELDASRQALANLYGSIGVVRRGLESAVSVAMPRRAPNVTALLGPLLAARMISQAGGLARLARLPASTIQMLGAERAFFDHLRGKAPPPRHGLLFLHPTIQSMPRRQRGKLARALAGKVAIAARLDASGGALRPELLAAYESRRTEVRSAAQRAERPPRPGGPRDRSSVRRG